jgi:hypothetical protein
LILNGSFTDKLRNLHHQGKFSKSDLSFLQNIQNTKSNNYRHITVHDELQRTTVSQQQTQLNLDGTNCDISTADDILVENNNDDFNFTQNIDYYTRNVSNRTSHNDSVPALFNLTLIRNKGRLKCGYDKLPMLNKKYHQLGY